MTRGVDINKHGECIMKYLINETAGQMEEYLDVMEFLYKPVLQNNVSPKPTT
jgi:hypothetical protein